MTDNKTIEKSPVNFTWKKSLNRLTKRKALLLIARIPYKHSRVQKYMVLEKIK